MSNPVPRVMQASFQHNVSQEKSVFNWYRQTGSILTSYLSNNEGKSAALCDNPVPLRIRLVKDTSHTAISAFPPSTEGWSIQNQCVCCLVNRAMCLWHNCTDQTEKEEWLAFMHVKCEHNLSCTCSEHIYHKQGHYGVGGVITLHKRPFAWCSEANKGWEETFCAICLLEDIINLLYEVSGLVKRRVNKAAHNTCDRWILW